MECGVVTKHFQTIYQEARQIYSSRNIMSFDIDRCQLQFYLIVCFHSNVVIPVLILSGRALPGLTTVFTWQCFSHRNCS